MTAAARKRQRSLSCNPAEQAMVRGRAAAQGRTLSRHVLSLIEADDPDRHPVVLTEAEQVELLEGVRAMRAFVRAAAEEAGAAGVIRSSTGAPSGDRT